MSYGNVHNIPQYILKPLQLNKNILRCRAKFRSWAANHLTLWLSTQHSKAVYSCPDSSIWTNSQVYSRLCWPAEGCSQMAHRSFPSSSTLLHPFKRKQWGNEVDWNIAFIYPPLPLLYTATQVENRSGPSEILIFISINTCCLGSSGCNHIKMWKAKKGR